MNLCRVSIDEIAHDIPAGKYQAAIVSKTAELLADRFDPMTDENFLSFFGADLSHQGIKFLLMRRDELKLGSDHAVDRTLRLELFDFYRGLAKQEAKDQIDNAHCGHCFDAGCHHCIEQEVE